MNIGSVARQSGVPAKTIRYYESVGLIQPAERSASGYRVYDPHDVETLRVVQRAMAERRVADIDRKMAELAEMRDTLTHLMERCHGDARPECPILQGLAGKPAATAN